MTPASPSRAPRLLRLADIAEVCQVSLRTVQSWVASGRLAVLRLSPRSVRVTEEALAEFLEHAAGGRP